MNLREKYKRTKCDCEACIRHCRIVPGCLGPGDLESIAEYLQTDIEQAYDLFNASPGAIVGCKGKLFRIGTIVPKKTQAGPCIFLDSHGRCEIHLVAPFGCAYFDEHLDPAEANTRSRDMHMRVLMDRRYNQHRQNLVERGQMSRPPEELRELHEKEAVNN